MKFLKGTRFTVAAPGCGERQLRLRLIAEAQGLCHLIAQELGAMRELDGASNEDIVRSYGETWACADDLLLAFASLVRLCWDDERVLVGIVQPDPGEERARAGSVEYGRDAIVMLVEDGVGPLDIPVLGLQAFQEHRGCLAMSEGAYRVMGFYGRTKEPSPAPSSASLPG